jgi:hypothetical protein
MCTVIVFTVVIVADSLSGGINYTAVSGSADATACAGWRRTAGGGLCEEGDLHIPLQRRSAAGRTRPRWKTQVPLFDTVLFDCRHWSSRKCVAISQLSLSLDYF